MIFSKTPMKTAIWSALTATSALTGIVATTNIANASTITQNASFGPATTNISDQPISIEKFDPSQGMLNSVKIDFTGLVNGDVGFENKDAQPATVTVTLSADISLKLPDGTPLLALSPTNETQTSVASYDGTTDFSGPSGRTFQGLSAEKSGTQTFTDSSLLKLFTGTGDANILFSALATSTVKGTGNIASYVDTSAGAKLITVTYNYGQTPTEVPETTPILGLGLVAGLGIASLGKKTLKARRFLG
jgi:hypothetical protein